MKVFWRKYIVSLSVLLAAFSVGAAELPPPAESDGLSNTENIKARPQPVTNTINTQPRVVSKPADTRIPMGFCHHEFAIWGAGGFSTLKYSPTIGEQKDKFGGSFGLGYTYFFNEKWGLNLGLEMALYSAEMSFPLLTDTYEDAGAQYRTTVRELVEKQQIINLNAPVMAQFQTNTKNKFYTALGIKVGVPLVSKYKVSASNFVHNQLDYAPYNGLRTKDKLDMNILFSGALDLGIKWQLSEKMSLYTGAYVDYTLNDLMKTHEDKFVEYDNNDRITTQNSILTSQYTEDGITKSFTDKVSPLSFGIKLRLGFNMCYAKWKKANDAAKKTTVSRPVAQATRPTTTVQTSPTVTPTTTPSAQSSAPTSISAKPIIVGKPIYNPVDGSYSLSPDQLAQIVKQVEMEDQIRAMIREIAKEDEQRAATEYVDVQNVFVLNISGYKINESNLTPPLEQALDLLIEDINQYKNRLIICEGHTCDIGSDARNLVLGMERADAVRSYLLKNGFSPDNVVATSKGESEPMLPNTSEANRIQNRRVVFIIK